MNLPKPPASTVPDAIPLEDIQKAENNLDCEGVVVFPGEGGVSNLGGAKDMRPLGKSEQLRFLIPEQDGFTPLKYGKYILRAWDVRLGKVVRLKLVPYNPPLNFGDSEGSRHWQSGFVEQALEHAKYEHPAILPVYTAFDWMNKHKQRYACYAMQECAGSLNDVELNIPETLECVLQIASALDYMHSHPESPRVFGDVKPANILYTQAGSNKQFYLADFEATAGTLAFSPEQVLSSKSGIEYFSELDTYQFAAMVLTLLFWPKPGEENEIRSVLHYLRKENTKNSINWELTLPGRFGTDRRLIDDQYRIKAELLDVFRRALSPRMRELRSVDGVSTYEYVDPEGRYQTCREFVVDLFAALKKLGIDVPELPEVPKEMIKPLYPQDTAMK